MSSAKRYGDQLPFVQVLMPAYNAEEYIADSLDSLMSQSYRNYEVIVLNDGSSDRTGSILDSLSEKYSILTVIHKPYNQGIIECRNELFGYAQAEFIALADADDIYHSERLTKQVEFLLKNTDVVAVSCWYEYFGERSGIVRLPKKYEEINAYMTLDNVFLNPGAMINCQVANGDIPLLSEDYRGASDYQFWKLLNHKGLLAILPEVLCHYRVHSKQESQANNMRQRYNHLRLVEDFLLEVDADVFRESLAAIIWPDDSLSKAKIKQICWEINKTIKALIVADIKNKENIIHVWDLRLKSLCRRYGATGLVAYIAARGLRNLIKGKNYGLAFALSCIRG